MQIVPEQILIRIAARSEPHQTGIGYVRESVGPGIGDNLVHKSKRIEVADSLGKVRLQRLIEAKAKRGCSRITVKLWSEPQVRHPGHENVCRPDTLQSGHDPEFVVYDGEGHGWLKVENRLDFWGRVERFLDKNLNDAPAPH